MNVSTSLQLDSARPWPLLAAGLLMLSVGMSNLGNYAFNGLVSRALPPAQFGAYGIAFAVITVGAVPINVIRLAFVRETAASLGSRVAAPPLAWIAALGNVLGPLSVLLPLLLVLTVGVPRLWPEAAEAPAVVVLVILILAAMVLVYAGRGLLQGSLRLGSVSLSIFVEHLLRLSIFGALLLLSDSSQVPLIAMLIGLMGSWFATGRLLRSGADVETAERSGQGMLRRLLPTMAVFLVAYVAHTALFSADIILAGFFLDRTLLGEYAALSLAGRIILFANLGVAELVLPAATMPGPRMSTFVGRSVVLGAAIPVPILLAYLLFPGQGLSILFGEGMAGLAGHLPLFGTAMYILSLAGILLSLLLARGLGWYAAAAAVAAALLEVALLVGRHADVGEIVSDVLVAVSIYALALTVMAAATVGWRRSVDTEPLGA